MLTRSLQPSDPQTPDAHYEAYEAYEALRARMIGSTATAPVGGVGLALLLQQGVAAWLHAVSSCSSPCSSPCNIPSPPRRSAPPLIIAADDARSPRLRGADLIPLAQHAEVATLLAGLALSARPTRHAPTIYDGASP